MKQLIVVAAAVVMVVMVLPRGASAFTPLAGCDPDCTGTVNGDKVVDPQNCTNFYYCINGEPASHATPCDTGNIFDPATSSCVVGTDCDPVCGPGGSGCALTCNSALDFVADAFDCSTYHLCTPGGTEPASCPLDRPYFDGSACVTDESVCCTGYCEPYCNSTGFALVPDPLDCTMFYVCDAVEGVPDDTVHFVCGDGKYFDVALGNCAAAGSDPCRPLSEAAPGGCGGSTSGGGGTTSGGGGTTSGGGGTTSGGGGTTSGGGGTTSGGGGTTSGGGGTTSGGGGTTSGGGGTTSGGGGTTSGGGGTTSPGDCVTSFTCEAGGFFPACRSCQPEYFDCSGAGVPGVLGRCEDGTVFNPTPGYGFCVMASNCPYP